MPPEIPLGRVQLVGAGPGPADLLTLRALRAIEGAGALLYDALVQEEVLALAPAACLKIQTGKRAGRPSMKQQTIHRLMLRLARRGLTVVRLKGGDPSIFGRVGEELDFLRGHGVAVEVIPGVTAACAAAAQAGVPLTHRGVARSVTFATATLEHGRARETFRADPSATLAIYMGRDQIAAFSARLIAEGHSPATPALAVENAGGPGAVTIRGTLATLAALLAAERFEGPVVVLVGEAVRAAERPGGTALVA
ncbi:MAG TPA: uroporphyrinogen-III C-methyltransferase [Phenylobacterium sp.]|nr:uroporphyrinogen-III C-methyltransferase [Phenylobacterium sp.]